MYFEIVVLETPAPNATFSALIPLSTIILRKFLTALLARIDMPKYYRLTKKRRWRTPTLKVHYVDERQQRDSFSLGSWRTPTLKMIRPKRWRFKSNYSISRRGR